MVGFYRKLRRATGSLRPGVGSWRGLLPVGLDAAGVLGGERLRPGQLVGGHLGGQLIAGHFGGGVAPVGGQGEPGVGLYDVLGRLVFPIGVQEAQVSLTRAAALLGGLSEPSGRLLEVLGYSPRPFS